MLESPNKTATATGDYHTWIDRSPAPIQPKQHATTERPIIWRMDRFPATENAFGYSVGIVNSVGEFADVTSKDKQRAFDLAEEIVRLMNLEATKQ